MSVEFDLSPTFYQSSATSSATPVACPLPRAPSDVSPAPVELKGSLRQRRRPVRLSTPSSTPSPCKSRTYDFKPSERKGALPDSDEMPPAVQEASQQFALIPQLVALSSRSTAGSSTPPQRVRERAINLGLSTPTPQSCASNPHRFPSSIWNTSPRTPDPARDDLKLLSGDVSVVFFDFDGTLTATPGVLANRHATKSAELCERKPLLSPQFKKLRDRGIVLGIISKSTEFTVRTALEAAGLADFFDGPIVGKAVGLEGKAGFIEEMVSSNILPVHENAGLQRIMLVDDDVHELQRAAQIGVQTWPAPPEGGLQLSDFEQILARIDFGAGGAKADEAFVKADVGI